MSKIKEYIDSRLKELIVPDNVRFEYNHDNWLPPTSAYPDGLPRPVISAHIDYDGKEYIYAVKTD